MSARKKDMSARRTTTPNSSVVTQQVKRTSLPSLFRRACLGLFVITEGGRLASEWGNNWLVNRRDQEAYLERKISILRDELGYAELVAKRLQKGNKKA